MPQPLSKVSSEANVIMCNAGDRPLKHNPTLGLLAMESIISWANVEQFMLNTYLDMMGGPKELAATAYLSLEIQSAKISVINAISREILTDEMQALLAAILKIAKSAQKSRDKLAHHIWGYSPEIPDGFLLVHPKDFLADRLDRDAIYVWKQADFESVIRLNDRLCDFGATFSQIFHPPPWTSADALYRELCAEPEIRERLSDQA